MTTTERLRNVQLTKPIWEGPESNGKQGGVTQSLLGAFLACPTRFKAKVVDNLKPRDRFNHRMEYGNMFHLCDEVYSRTHQEEKCRSALQQYTSKLLIHYPFDQEDILKWSRVCTIQFPVYIDYWRTQHENPDRKSLVQEEVFHVPYHLPSGRTVYLRGRWDGVELDEQGLWLNESKSRGTVDPLQIQRRLRYDIQTMLYLIALKRFDWSKKFDIMDSKSPLSIWKGSQIQGVKYNVVRRPLSGGKGTIKQTKNETVDQYYDRLAQYIRGEPEAYFFRWESKVSDTDIEEFEKNTLIPCLERLCSWYYQYVTSNLLAYPIDIAWINYISPFGVNHVTDEYGSDYDDYIMNGSTIGLVKCDNLFPEL